MTRAAFLADHIGKPWDWQKLNCWEFAALVERKLFGRLLPHVEVPDQPAWRWMVGAIAAHPERARWASVGEGPHGLVTAADGALCLMGRNIGFGHIGVWLRPEGKVIHCSREFGVCFETPLALRQQGWLRRDFFEPLAG